MRPSLSIKTLFRSPLKTLLTFVLLAAASFMLVYTASDFALTNREYTNSVGTYRGLFTVEYDIGSQDGKVPNFLLSDNSNNVQYKYTNYEDKHQKSISKLDIESILSLPYVTSVSTRYMTSGISKDYWRKYVLNADFRKDFFNVSARFVIEATFEGIEDVPSRDYDIGAYKIPYIGKEGLLKALHVKDIKLLAGDDDFHRMVDKEGENLELLIYASPYINKDYPYIMMLVGNAIVLNFYVVNQIYTEQLDTLVTGNRYIFTGRAMPYNYMGTEAVHSLCFGDDTIYGWWPYIYPLDKEDLNGNYLEKDKFEPLRELIQVTNDDAHTLDVVYTDDMTTIRRVVDDKILITQGRLLTPEDSESKSKVCVVSDIFLKDNKLKLGDTIKFKLGNKLCEQYAPLGAVASFKGRYASEFVDEEFEIVGTYIDTNINNLRAADLYWAYNDYSVFVPLCFLPESVNLDEHEFKPAEISFVIDDPRNISTFMEECMPKLEEMGLTVYFDDGGWLRLEEQFDQAKSLALSKLFAFTAASALASILTVFLFIGRKKRDYAIMRALGTTKMRTGRTLFVPLSLLAFTAILLGAVAAYIYSGYTAVDTLKAFADMGLEVNTTVPMYVVLLGVLGGLLLVLLLAALSLYRTGKLPPLVLLQENTNRNSNSNRKAKTDTTEASEQQVFIDKPLVAVDSVLSIESLLGIHKQRAQHQVMSYILKHCRRAVIKSLLSLLLAAILLGAIGQFTAVKETYNELYKNIIIKARFVNGLSYTRALQIENSGYVSSPYYERIEFMEVILPGANPYLPTFIDLYISNNINRLTTEPIEFIEGYDENSVMNITEKICILSASLMDSLGLKLGDVLEINNNTYMWTLGNNFPNYTNEQMTEAYHKHSVLCKIVGRIETDSLGDMVCVPVSAVDRMFKSLVFSLGLNLAEYVLNDYNQAEEFRAYGKKIANSSREQAPLFIMDTSEADNIYKIYRLIEALYPLAVAVAILLGAVLPGLIIIQSAKEASIMRVLGTTKRRTRTILILEQMMLCIIGLIIAFAILIMVNRANILKLAEPLCTYCLLHLISCTVGTTIAAITVTRRKILELLQVKE